MKKLFIFAVILLLSAGAAQSQVVINYPFAAAEYQSVTATNDSVQFTVSNQVSWVYSSIDSTTVVSATVAGHITNGAILYVELAADGTNRTVTFSGLTGPSTTFTASKTRILTFVYRSGYKLVSSAQIN